MKKKICMILGISLLLSLIFSPVFSMTASAQGTSDVGVRFIKGKTEEMTPTPPPEKTADIQKPGGSQAYSAKNVDFPKMGEELMTVSVSFIGIILLAITGLSLYKNQLTRGGKKYG